MKNAKFLLLFLLVFSLACDSHRMENAGKNKTPADSAMGFEKAKWLTKKGLDYPYRDQLVDDILYSDSVRTLKTGEILSLLGEPDRINENHYYYMITQRRLYFWPLHTKTLVIKFSPDSTVEWIKIHE